MRRSFELEVLTRERRVLLTQVTEAVVPGFDGYLGILAGHAPLVTALGVGQLTLQTPEKGVKERIAISGGFMEVRPEKTVVLAETAERAEEIDAARAKAALDRAKQRLAESAYAEIDTERAKRALLRALNRLRTLDN